MEGSPRLGSKGLIKKHEFVRIIIQCLLSIGYEKSASCLELESGISCKSDDFQMLESQKEVSTLHVDRGKVHNLARSSLSSKEMEQTKIDDIDVCELRKKLLQELEKLLPPPITLPENRFGLSIRMKFGLYNFLIGEYLASSSSDCTAIIWKVLEDGRVALQHTLRSHQKPVSFLARSPDDSKLLTCGNVEVLKLWDVETGTCKHTFGDPGFIVSSCAWFPDSRRLVCGSSDPEKGIYMWDSDGNELKAWRGMRMPKILDLAVTPDGENLISIFSDKEIRILNVGTNAERVISEDNSITSLSISGDSKFFIVNLNSQEIHMWDVAGEWEKPLKFTGHKQSKYVIRSCFGGLNSTFIASGSEFIGIHVESKKF